MEKIKKFFIPLLLTLLLIAPMGTLVASAYGSDQPTLEEIISDTTESLLRISAYPGIGQTGGDWAVVALARSGAQMHDSFFQDYYEKAVKQIRDLEGVLSSSKYSEYSRVVIAMSAIGANPRDIGGYDILAPLWDYDATVYQGINGPAFAIVALGASGHLNESFADMYVEYILSRQFEDGGFAMSGTASDSDTTAIIITALSVYARNSTRDRMDVSSAIDRGVERLSMLQRSTGGFTSYGSTNSESVAQSIIALCSSGIDINDERFVKNGNSFLDNLLTYYIKGEGFEHEIGNGVNQMATEQALCALAALWRYKTGQCCIYDMSDAPSFRPGTPGYGLPGKHPDVTVPEMLDAGALFVGTGADSDKPATRAEFIAALIYALGLKTSGDTPVFRDVNAENRFMPAINAAHYYGIVTGRGEGIFDPYGPMTRQEAAVAVARASRLCGLGEGVQLDETAIRNLLSQFIDYRSVAPWAREELSYCYNFGILDDSEIEIIPNRNISIKEAAGMIFIMLEKSRLLIS